ncbi:MAG TPA: nuclear transport factor 2 family protein [Candidatus Binatia bacterium]|nr:nuclear transport factor 2 family protein [Candidatus Binatia bacterium]
MVELGDIEARLRALEDLEAIKRLKYRYWRCLDLKQFDALADCFTEDATASYSDGRYRFAGREAIVAFLRDALGPASGSVGFHHGLQPEIELTGLATARGTWALHNYFFNERQNRGVRIAAFYDDEYAKQAGVWRLRHTGYRAVFHEEWRRDEPGRVTRLA